MTIIFAELKITPEALLSELTGGRRVEIEQWRLSGDEDGLWATNPYGIDTGWWPFDLEGCRRALATIAADAAADADEDREWGHL